MIDTIYKICVSSVGGSKSYVTDNKSYAEISKAYIGNTSLLRRVNKSYVGDIKSYLGIRKLTYELVSST